MAKPRRIIRKSEVLKRVGYSDPQIWRLEQQGKFPKRVKLGPKAVGWVESEIEEWIEERINARGKETPVLSPRVNAA